MYPNNTHRLCILLLTENYGPLKTRSPLISLPWLLKLRNATFKHLELLFNRLSKWKEFSSTARILLIPSRSKAMILIIINIYAHHTSDCPCRKLNPAIVDCFVSSLNYQLTKLISFKKTIFLIYLCLAIKILWLCSPQISMTLLSFAQLVKKNVIC